MLRYKAIIEYDGTGLAGWQRQDDYLSVQEVLENAIFNFCQEDVKTTCSGRTDAGVHSRGQVVSFDLQTDRELRNIQHGINYHLQGKNVAVVAIELADDEFNARFDAIKRHYRYHIVNRQAPLVLDDNRAWVVHQSLDIKKMQEGAKYLIGNHDFTSFRASQCQAKSATKTLDRIEISREGDNIYIEVEALSFLHHMVRNIVGTLKLVGEGKWQPEDIKITLEACDRKEAGPTAPACGLYFMKVDY